ncbi:hypothetical protein AB0A94_13375 [Streptomyces sp. NPDC044984]|uniref:hypothetical protein n=1 Tax=Streptomyces sp. NPDC044984 TaxID=3154335 RepID=UPI0033D710B9
MRRTGFRSPDPAGATSTPRAAAFPPLPEGTEAHPLRVSLGRRAVAVVPAGHPDRAHTVRALMDSAPDGSERPLERSGEHLFRGDQVVVRIRNRRTARRFVSVFDIGLRGTISLLTTSERSGVGAGPGECHELYRHPRTHELAGVTLFRPDGLPEGSPRPGTFLAVVTDRPQDLSRLAQEGVKHTPEARDSSLQRLLGDLLNGVRDGHAPAWADGGNQVVRYRVERFEAYLHPERRTDPRS